MSIKITKVDSSEDLAKCLSIRAVVFVGEQGDRVCNEFDEFDDTTAVHFLAEDGQGNAVGTCRYRIIDQNNMKIGKLERVAVLSSARGQGIAQQVCQAALSDMAKTGLENAKTHAQTYAVPLYQKLGFEAYGEEFEEANIPHRSMEMALSEVNINQ